MIKNLVKDSSVYGIFGVISGFTATFLVPFYTRIFSIEDFAILDFLIATLVVLAALSGAWIDSGFARNYFLKQEKGTIAEFTGTGIILGLLSSILCTILFAIVYSIFFFNYAETTWLEVIPLLLILVPRRLHAFGLQLCRLQFRQTRFMIVALGNVLFSAILSVFLAMHLGVSGVLWGYVLARTLFGVGVLISLRDQFTLTFSTQDAYEMFSFGILQLPAFLGQWIQNYASRIILIGSLALTSVGHFSLALKIAGVGSLIFLAFNQAWIPYYNKLLDQPDCGKKFARILNLYLLVMMAVAVGIGAITPILVPLLGTQEYMPAVLIVSFIILGAVWDGSVKILDAGISKQRATKWTGISVVLGWLLHIAIVLLTVDTLGFVSAGVAYIISTTFTALLVYFASQRLYPMPYNKLIISLSIVLSFVIALINWMAVLQPTSANIADNIQLSLLRLAIGGGLWLILLYFVGREENITSPRLLIHQLQNPSNR